MRKRLTFELLCMSCLLAWGGAKASEIQREKVDNADPIATQQARVWTTRGQVEILNPSHEMVLWRSAKLKDKLADGSVVATGDGRSSAELVFPDHSRIRIAANSVVELNAAAHRVYVRTGNIVFKQARNKAQAQEYSIYTPKHLVVPSGTMELSVNENNDQCRDLGKNCSRIVNLSQISGTNNQKEL